MQPPSLMEAATMRDEVKAAQMGSFVVFMLEGDK